VPRLEASLAALGTTRISADSHPFRIVIRNRGDSNTATLRFNAPAGWIARGLPSSVQLASNERKTIDFNVDTTASDGPAALELVITSGGATYAAKEDVIRQTGTSLVFDAFESGVGAWGVERPDNAGWTVQSAPNGVSGNCLEIKDKGGAHWGRVNAFGGFMPDGKRDPKFMGFDASVYRYVDFYVRADSLRNFAMCVTLDDGKRCVVMLTGPFEEQWGETVQLPRAKFVPNGSWNRIVYDLGGALRTALGARSAIVTDIALGDSRTFSSNQFFSNDVITRYVDEFRIMREANLADNSAQEDPDAELKPGADFTSASAEERARALAGIVENATPEQLAAARRLLADPSPHVRMNAARVFTQNVDPESVQALVQAVRLELDPYAGVTLVHAIEKQNNPQGFAALAELLLQGRFEELPVGEAALALGRTKDPKQVPNLAIAITARSWLTRRAGAAALGLIPGDVAQQTLMMYLLEVDPMVRLTVGKNAMPDVEPGNRRMEWGSINDLSDVVRAYDYAALCRSSDPVRRSRGYAGLKEANPDIRRIIAEELQNDSKEYHVQFLAGLLSDPVPEVRAAALVSLLKMPGKRDFSEISVLAGEDYEEVLVPLLGAARDGALTVPAAMLDRLATHRNAEVRKLVQEVKKR
jgi:HEAT repeat protein